MTSMSGVVSLAFTLPNIKILHLCSFVHVAICIHELVVMTSMSGVVQLAFMKSLAVWDDTEIYTDTIGLEVTLQLAQIDVEDF